MANTRPASQMPYETAPRTGWLQLLAATLVALLILITIVLPAEYAIDPTGAGRLLGLTELNQVKQGAIDPAALLETPVGPMINSKTSDADRSNNAESGKLPAAYFSETARKEDALTLTLQPGQGAEIKAVMNKGQRLFFNWQADGLLYVDMHGEEPNASAEDFTQYRAQLATRSEGALTAEFPGTHGWYWKNDQLQPITIELQVTGYYQAIYMP
jgi:hypothetical protein